MRKVPFEVAVAVCIRSIDPVSVDAEQLRQKQCSAAPPDDSTDQAGGTDHEKKVSTERGLPSRRHWGIVGAR
jgi:hypothetical protein